MNIYLVERTDSVDYDEFDSFVIITENEDIAKNTNPDGNLYNINEDEDISYSKRWKSSWCNSPNKVKVTLIGIANENISPGIIHTSFCAG